MRIIYLAFVLLLTPIAFSKDLHQNKFNYPQINRTDHIDEYHGKKISDPYFWLENENDKETENWIIAQNQVTNDYLKNISYRNKITERLTKVWNFASMSVPKTIKDKTFFYYNTGTQNHSLLYMKEAKDTNLFGKVILDPNIFSEDGTVAMTSADISPDVKYVAYSFSKSGSDWTEIKVKEIETGKTLEDHIKWVKFSKVTWKGNGFFYSAYDMPKNGTEYSAKNEFHKIYYHKIGTSQEMDTLVYEDKEHPMRIFRVDITSDGNFLILGAGGSSNGNSLNISDVSKWQPEDFIDWIPIISDLENSYSLVDHISRGLLFLTSDNAKNNKLILIDPKKPQKENWKTIIPEMENVLESVTLSNHKLILNYLVDVSSRLKIFSLDGELENEIKLPGIGKVTSVSASLDSPQLYYSFVSYIAPEYIIKFDMTKNINTLYFKADIDFDSDNYETKQIFYPSKDGTRIPMFITHKKGLKINGKNPTFLYGYGGFNISITPEFRVDRTVFLENGGIYAVANIRGGGEYGEMWHNAGMQFKKQNVFDDFISAAEYLIQEGYTNSEYLAVHGRSNGGLLAGAVLTQRPDLFKVVIPQVGVLDMLKFHTFTIGWAWTREYGSSTVKEQFDYLTKYSPLHNVPEGCLPATLVMTGDHDDRVVPAHSYKFISELQFKSHSCDNPSNENPLMIRIDTNGGHGAGKPLSMQISEYSDMWSFVFYNLGMSQF